MAMSYDEKRAALIERNYHAEDGSAYGSRAGAQVGARVGNRGRVRKPKRKVYMRYQYGSPAQRGTGTSPYRPKV